MDNSKLKPPGVSMSRLWPAVLSDRSVRYALVIFTVSRVFVSIWALLVLTVNPIPAEPDEVLRPYLGEPQLSTGAGGALLGPWQRFDTLRYLRIARQGYDAVEDSVFPPLYPLFMSGLGWLLGGFRPVAEGNLIAGIVLSNLAFIASLILLYRIAAAEMDESSARRSIVYFTVFPTGFFLLAAYTESLFIFFALAAIWAARRGRFWSAGISGLLASLTRLTGWILVVPLTTEYLSQRNFEFRRIGRAWPATLLPLLGIAGFLFWRQAAGLPPLAEVYKSSWLQTTGFPGIDILEAIREMLAGGSAFRLYFDFFCALLLLVTTALAFRRLGPTYGTYSAMLLLFMLLPTSSDKPLFSFSRYVLAFFPTFVVLGQAGRNPWLNRLIIYPSVAFYLYFSGQFFMWGWVA